MLSKQVPLGIYEKALPAGECWLERLQLAKQLGFDFVEMSVDETDERLSRLDWRRDQRLAPRPASGAGERHCRNRRARAIHVPERSSSFSAWQRR